MRQRVSYVDALGRVYVPNNLSDDDDIDAPTALPSATFTVLVPPDEATSVASAVVQFPVCSEHVVLQTIAYYGSRHVGEFVVTATYVSSRRQRRRAKTLGVRLEPL